ncbi:MAG: winged helix-turn-helix transcriptional regulator [Myxococcales bacterium]|nr:winged helix-turn-helix transcriptional regulator [Myxococcales bacterium]
MSPHLAHVQVAEAVHAAALRRREVSIAEIAEELGLDRSGASRMVSAAAEAGCVVKRVAGDDARRSQIELTRRGRALLRAAHHWQQSTFERLTATWPDEDAQRFASYLLRLSKQALVEGTL